MLEYAEKLGTRQVKSKAMAYIAEKYQMCLCCCLGRLQQAFVKFRVILRRTVSNDSCMGNVFLAGHFNKL